MTMSGPPNIAERYAYFDGGSTMYLIKSYETAIQYSLSHWAVMHEARAITAAVVGWGTQSQVARSVLGGKSRSERKRMRP